uniref:Uncharacterized protein n=1 Tax=Populus trichocarpa TaxID=3694 RepID=A0A3N7EN56_POPTR
MIPPLLNLSHQLTLLFPELSNIASAMRMLGWLV